MGLLRRDESRYEVGKEELERREERLRKEEEEDTSNP